MTTPAERLLLDTNVWIFGLRRDTNFPACASLLDQIGSFSVSVIIPLQVLKELAVNLIEVEMQDFYRLVNNYHERVEVSWAAAPAERVTYYQERGCRKGDAVIAAHAEALGANLIVSENRQFLQTIADLPVGMANAAEALKRLS
jgi:predicted nucleic acid-binding protein